MVLTGYMNIPPNVKRYADGVNILERMKKECPFSHRFRTNLDENGIYRLRQLGVDIRFPHHKNIRYFPVKGMEKRYSLPYLNGCARMVKDRDVIIMRYRPHIVNGMLLSIDVDEFDILKYKEKQEEIKETRKCPQELTLQFA